MRMNLDNMQEKMFVNWVLREICLLHCPPFDSPLFLIGLINYCVLKRTSGASQGRVCFKWAINRLPDFIELLSSLWQILMSGTTWLESEPDQLKLIEIAHVHGWIHSLPDALVYLFMCLRDLPKKINEGERLGNANLWGTCPRGLMKEKGWGMECQVHCWVNTGTNAWAFMLKFYNYVCIV